MQGVIVRQVLNESLVFSILCALLGLTAAFFTAEGLLSQLVQEITYPKLPSIEDYIPWRR